MSFTPVIPMAGYAGWRFLARTMDDQSASLNATPAISRDMAYFRDHIGQVQSAGDLVQDYRLLRVALTAFGLQDDLPNKAFIRRILEDGVTDENALSNRLADKRYRDFSQAFGFGTGLPPLSRLPGFADRILAKFEARNFELAVGEVSDDMRLVLNAVRELPQIAAEDGRDSTRWLRIMGNPPLRSLFETAFGLPTAIGSLDLDRQLETFQERAEAILGDGAVGQFADPERVENLVRNFLARAQLTQGPAISSPAAIALSLLQGAV